MPIDKKVYQNWRCRHTFVDVVEITREVIVRVVKLFSDEIGFQEKRDASSRFKAIKDSDLNIEHVLELFQLDQKKYSQFRELYMEYKKNRNCLTHRLGEVTLDDKPPLFLSYYKVIYEVHAHGKIYKSKDPNEIVDVANKNHLEAEKQFGVSFDIEKHTYSEGEKIMISDDVIFGVASFLYNNAKKIFRDLLSETIEDLDAIFAKSDPFKVKFTVSFVEI